MEGIVWLGIGLGGALGALGRAACLQATEVKTHRSDVSLKPGARRALLIANTLGCFAIGLLVGGAPAIPEWLFLTIAVGFCGSLTTFSTLCAQLVQQFREPHGMRGASFQLGLNLLFGYGALVLGFAAGP